MRGWAWVAMLTLSFSGCLGVVRDQPEHSPPSFQLVETPLLEDAAGDARIWQTRDGIRSTTRLCDFPPTLTRDACRALQDGTANGPQLAGSPAPAFLDIVRADLLTSPEEVRLSLEVAFLDATLQGLADDGSEMALWALSYVPKGGWPETLYVRATKQDGTVYAYSGARAQDFACGGNKTTNPECETGCNASWWCEVAVRTTFEYGTPGRVLFHVPASEFGNNRMHMEEIVATTSIRLLPLGEATTGWRLDAGSASDQGWTSLGATTHADQAVSAAGVSLSLPAAGVEVPAHPYRVALPRGPTPNNALDVVAVEVEETQERFSIIAEVVEVEAAPSVDHDFKFYWSTTDGRTFFVAYWAEDGVRTNAFWEAADANGEWTSLPMNLDIVAGPSGQVRFSVARQDLGVQPGDMMNHFWLHVHDYLDEDTGTGTLTGLETSVFHNVNHDSEALPPFRFR